MAATCSYRGCQQESTGMVLADDGQFLNAFCAIHGELWAAAVKARFRPHSKMNVMDPEAIEQLVGYVDGRCDERTEEYISLLSGAELADYEAGYAIGVEDRQKRAVP